MTSHQQLLNLANLSCLEKQERITEHFNQLSSRGEFYQELMKWAKASPTFDQKYKTSDYLVRGCQSDLYLYCTLSDQKLTFFASSEALLSLGMAQLFLKSYSQETPLTIFSTPPIFSKSMHFYSSISMGRQQGMEALYLRIKFFAIQHLRD